MSSKAKKLEASCSGTGIYWVYMLVELVDVGMTANGKDVGHFFFGAFAGLVGIPKSA